MSQFRNIGSPGGKGILTTILERVESEKRRWLRLTLWENHHLRVVLKWAKSTEKKQIGEKQSQTVYYHENQMKGRILIKGGQ